MRTFLQNIYRKPKEVRDNYALAAAGLFTAIVSVFWVAATLQTPFAGEKMVSDSVGPFSTLVKKSKEQLAAVRAVVPEAALATEEVATSSASTSAINLILSEEDRAEAAAKATSTATSSPETQYIEVLIGTTSASTTAQ